MNKCPKCGKVFEEQARFCDRCGVSLVQVLSENPQQPNQQTPPRAAFQQTYQQTPPSRAPYGQPVYPQMPPPPGMPGPMAPTKQKGDFTNSPTGINVMSVIGFVLSILCIAFVWMQQISMIIFPIAIISLVLCMIVKAMKYNNIFAKIGFIIGLVVTIVSAIMFGIYFYEMVF